jgi:hypothetical protein
MFSSVSPEARVPQAHPLRALRVLVEGVWHELSRPFDTLSSHTGRPSIAPEQWRRALRLHVLYTIRRERLLRAQLDDNLLCRWGVGWNRADAVWEPTVFSKHREREWRSDDHGTVEGTLSDAGAGPKRCQRTAAAPPAPPPEAPGNPSLACRGERRTNAMQASTTAPAARLYKQAQGQEAKRASLGPGLMANRPGLVVETRVTQATGPAAREAAWPMAEAMPGQQRVTLGADKHDDTHDCVRERRVPPQVAQHTAGRSRAIDGRPTRHAGEAVSQRTRNGVEELWGWLKTVGRLRKARHRGGAQVGGMFTWAAAVYNVVRMRTLAAAA